MAEKLKGIIATLPASGVDFCAGNAIAPWGCLVMTQYVFCVLPIT